MGNGAYLLLAQAAGGHTNWGLLALILGGIFLFMIALRILGLFLAATHPAVRVQATEVIEESPAPPPGVDPKILAVVAATVAEMLQQPHRIVAVTKAPSVETLMQHWSLEGRRAIYSSHKFR